MTFLKAYFKNSKPELESTKGPIYLHVRRTQCRYGSQVSLNLLFPGVRAEVSVTTHYCPQYRTLSILSPDWCIVHAPEDTSAGSHAEFFEFMPFSILDNHQAWRWRWTQTPRTLQTAFKQGQTLLLHTTLVTLQHLPRALFDSSYCCIKDLNKQIPFTPSEVIWSLH